MTIRLDYSNCTVQFYLQQQVLGQFQHSTIDIRSNAGQVRNYPVSDHPRITSRGSGWKIYRHLKSWLSSMFSLPSWLTKNKYEKAVWNLNQWQFNFLILLLFVAAWKGTHALPHVAERPDVTRLSTLSQGKRVSLFSSCSYLIVDGSSFSFLTGRFVVLYDFCLTSSTTITECKHRLTKPTRRQSIK